MGLVFLLFAVFALASISAQEPKACIPKKGHTLFLQESPAPKNGNCEDEGLVWKGRDLETQFKDNDQFFTKWSDFFHQPECIGEIEVEILDISDPQKRTTKTIADFDLSKVKELRQNPSNTIL